MEVFVGYCLTFGSVRVQENEEEVSDDLLHSQAFQGVYESGDLALWNVEMA
jgi:hypothetical protein